jgi:streptogramin lyase
MLKIFRRIRMGGLRTGLGVLLVGPGCAMVCASFMAPAAEIPAARAVSGQVLDVNGHPLSQAMVTLQRADGEPGASATTVFTNADGRFQFPGTRAGRDPSVRLLGYRTEETIPHGDRDGLHFDILMRAQTNQAGTAPASAYLSGVDPGDKAVLIMTCTACHQMPAPEVRAYAKLIYDIPRADPAEARAQSWHAIVQYMNYLSAWDFGRGGNDAPLDPNRVYSGGPVEPTTALLARTMHGSFQEVTHYAYGAPVIADEHTVIREFEVPRPNAIREGLTLKDPGVIWLADVSANRVLRLDTSTGAVRALEIPSDKVADPHTLLSDPDGNLWVAPFFNGIISRLDPRTEKWSVWPLVVPGIGPPALHDLAFGADRHLLTDKQGRIWYTEIVHNAVGWFDPKTGKSATYPIPEVSGRVGAEQTYGMAMSSDRTHVWYSQLGIGAFGSFNTDTLKFEDSVVLPDRNAGPRRITMGDGDILYVALFGAGQLAAYDTRAHRMIGIYDLPDRAAAPYAVTWDPRRKVVWIAASNADAIYRFDPRDQSFGVLPLPRPGAFLRMLAIDQSTGALVTSYANLVEFSPGPRMAVMIDLGDSRAK